MREACQASPSTHDEGPTELPADRASVTGGLFAIPVRRAILARAAMLASAFLVAGIGPAHFCYAAATRIVDIVVRNGTVVGSRSVRVTKGDTVVLRWTSDRKLDLHLHGYDVTATVGPGTPAEMKVYARATGRFPVAIHVPGSAASGHGHHNIFHLEVYPD